MAGCTRFVTYRELFEFSEEGDLMTPDLKTAQCNTIKNYLKKFVNKDAGGEIEEKKSKRRVSIDNSVRVFKYDNKLPLHGNAVSLQETRDVIGMARQQIPSTLIIEKHIHGVITVVPFRLSLVGTHSKLMSVLSSEFEGLTIEQVRQDFRKIHDRFSKGMCFVMNYKQSFKLSPTFPEQKHAKGVGWYYTGMNVPCLPRVRRFLIRCCRDVEFASIAIQCAWRMHKARKIMKALSEEKWANDNAWLSEEARDYPFECMFGNGHWTDENPWIHLPSVANDAQSVHLTGGGGGRKVVRCPECTRPLSEDGKCKKCNQRTDSPLFIMDMGVAMTKAGLISNW